MDKDNQPLRNLVDEVQAATDSDPNGLIVGADVVSWLQALIDQSCNVSLMACEPDVIYPSQCWTHYGDAERPGTFDAQKPEPVTHTFHAAEFASDTRFQSGRIGIAAPATTADFRIVAPIQRDGPLVTIAVTPKEALSNHLYDFHVTVEGRSDQHIQIRNGQAITESEVRLADLNADGLLDIMITGGPDHRGRDWYKTFLYDRDKGGYHWITDEATPDSPDK